MWKYLLSGGIMFIITYRLAMIMNMTIPNLAIEVIIGAVIYIIGIFILRAPVINQAIVLINSRKAKESDGSINNDTGKSCNLNVNL